MKKNRFILRKLYIFAKWFLRNGYVKKLHRYTFIGIIGKNRYIHGITMSKKISRNFNLVKKLRVVNTYWDNHVHKCKYYKHSPKYTQ